MQADDRFSRVCRRNHDVCHLCKLHSPAVILCCGGTRINKLRVHQRTGVNKDIGSVQNLFSLYGDKAGIAATGTDNV